MTFSQGISRDELGPCNGAVRQKVLVVRVGALGDTLMATPLVSALASREPGSRIDFLCSANAAGILREHPSIACVLTLEQRNWPIFLSSEKRSLIRQIRAQKYDLAILLESAPRYYDLLDSCSIGEIRSFRDCPFDPRQHSSRNHLHVAGFADWKEMPLHPFFQSGGAERERARQWLEQLPFPRVGFHCGYGPAGRKARPDQLKGWSLANFSAVARVLAAEGAACVLTGARGDIPATAKIASDLPAGAVLDLAGRTSVVELGAILDSLDLFISVDSGPAHLAAAVATPLIVLWGPAKFDQVHPLRNGAPVRVLREPLPCAPCYDTPAMKSCRANVCMQRIRPQRVIEEARNLLKELN